MAGFNSLVYILSTIPTWYLVDIMGRRPILLSGALIMACALSSTGYFLYLDKSFTPNAVVISIIIYNAAFGYSFGPIPWLYPPEILPNAFRAKGVSLSTATNWAFNFIVGEVTPMLQEKIRWRLYPMHAGFCLISFVVVYFAYPETAGVPLEEMDRVFGDSNNHRDVETAPLAIPASAIEPPPPPSSTKRGSQSGASRPPPESSPSLGTSVKNWFSPQIPSSSTAAVANYQTVRSDDE